MEQIVDLLANWSYLDYWIEQSGGTDHLLYKDASSLFDLPIARRGADVQNLSYTFLPLGEAKGAVELFLENHVSELVLHGYGVLGVLREILEDGGHLELELLLSVFV